MGPSTRYYTIQISDPEGGPVTITDTTIALPSFVTFSGGTYTWLAPFSLPISQNNITFRASDGINMVDKWFFINVTNYPPVFHPETTVYRVLSSYIYTTNIVDPEGNSVTLTAVSGNPSFMTLQSDMRTFNISPPYNIANGSTYPVTITFTDGCNYP